MSLKRAHSPDDSSDQVFRSSSITDRQSIFVAHYSPTLSARALQAHPDFKLATHRIAAWRRPSSQRSVMAHSQRVLDIGHDDDGESYAGKKLEKLLEGQKVEGAVCVARWYGGVMLGPVRFAHIENCAKQAIHAWRSAVTNAEQQKRQKVADAKLKQELEQMLAERDQSIQVLRSLLAEKRKAATKDESTPQPPAAALAKPMDYSKMPVEALRKLEKARDATISFILEEIDKLEAQMKENAPSESAQDKYPSDDGPAKVSEHAEKRYAPADMDSAFENSLPEDALIQAAKQAEDGWLPAAKVPSKVHENSEKKERSAEMDSAFEDSLPDDVFIEASKQVEGDGISLDRAPFKVDDTAEKTCVDGCPIKSAFESSLSEDAFVEAAKRAEDTFKMKAGQVAP